MTRTAIIGDGPAGLSAALFLAKNEHDTIVFAQDATLIHHAELHNYLGIERITGSDFQRVAREQVTAVGAEVRETPVEEITATGDGFTVRTSDGQTEVDNVVLAAGKDASAFAQALDLEQRDGAVVVDADGRTSQAGVYAAGHIVRPERSQAIISAGAGAAAALDILSRDAGKDIHDWDVPPDA